MVAPRVLSANNDTHPAVVEIVFDQDLNPNDQLVSTGNYLFNHGAYATEIIPIDERTVRVIVENLFDYTSFTVFVSSNITNMLGDGIDSNYNSAEFSTLRQASPNFLLAITSENGRLRSGNGIVGIDEDSNNWYLLTESGIDVVSKELLTNTAFLLDGYGTYTAICVN
jgi:hypothetical protein